LGAGEKSLQIGKQNKSKIKMPNKLSKAAIAKLEKRRDLIVLKLNAIREQEAIEENEKLLGKCYICENSYGGDSRYWNKYFIITEADSCLRIFSFEKTSAGKFEIVQNQWFVEHEGYEEISREEFDKAWSSFLEEITALNK
jgi:hypothetical protein